MLKKITNIQQRDFLRIQELEKYIKQDMLRKEKDDLFAFIHGQQCDPDDVTVPLPCRLYMIKMDGVDSPYDMQAAPCLGIKLEEYIDSTIALPHTFIMCNLVFILAVGGNSNYSELLLAWCKSHVHIVKNVTLTVAVSPQVFSYNDIYRAACLAFQGIACRLDGGTLTIYEETELQTQTFFDYTPFVNSSYTALMQENADMLAATAAAFKESVHSVLVPLCREQSILMFCKHLLARIGMEEGTDEYRSLLWLLEAAPTRILLWDNFDLFLRLLYKKCLVHRKSLL